jgi:hypothetical protein
MYHYFSIRQDYGLRLGTLNFANNTPGLRFDIWLIQFYYRNNLSEGSLEGDTKGPFRILKLSHVLG